jgi:hypothetical protein
MSVRKTLFVLGILLMFMPFPVIGLPQSWKAIFYFLTGLGLAAGSFVSYIRANAPRSSRKDEDNLMM